MQMSAQKQVFTVLEISRILGFHPDAVKYWLRVGELEGESDRTTGEWIIDAKEVESFLRANGETVPAALASA